VAGPSGSDPRIQAARLGALAAFTCVAVFVVIYDALSPEYEVSPLILTILVTTILTLAGFEVRESWFKGGPKT
jgi:hypothetical protein